MARRKSHKRTLKSGKTVRVKETPGSKRSSRSSAIATAPTKDIAETVTSDDSEVVSYFKEFLDSKRFGTDTSILQQYFDRIPENQWVEFGEIYLGRIPTEEEKAEIFASLTD